jgi:hypothetical protein
MRTPTIWLLTATLTLSAAGACSSASQDARQRISPTYNPDTGRLERLTYDSNADGKPDMWSLMNGTRFVSIQIDRDFDGTPERWEYYDENQQLQKVGFSRLHDGTEDGWTYTDPSGAIVRIEVSTRRDGHVQRIERYERGTIATADEDTDGDGRFDKWEHYEGGRITSVAFDTARRGVPDRRLTYAVNGTATLEIDRDGSGHFVRIP